MMQVVEVLKEAMIAIDRSLSVIVWVYFFFISCYLAPGSNEFHA